LQSKKTLLLFFTIILTFPLFAQEPSTLGKKKFFKNLYEDFLKSGTVYGAGDINNSIEAAEPTYFSRTNPDGSIYSIPDVVDNTEVFPYDYRYGFSIRKLARYDHERKSKKFL
jgi:hypothetical protein